MKRQHMAVAFMLALSCLAVLNHPGHHAGVTLSYIGPGAGFAFVGSFLTLVASLLASCVSIVAWPFRVLWVLLRRRNQLRNAIAKKVIFLGLDGLDPALTETWMDEGKLPNFSKLRDSGFYSRLRTTCPPLSPVAWSTFATGVNPAKHNIFDFLNRNLRTYAPELSSAKVRPPSRYLEFAGLKIPLSRPDVELRRKSEPFWKILSRHSVESTILRLPVSFPPEKFQGKMLSAMCTPDLLGTQGSFSWFTSNADRKGFEGGVRLPLRESDGALTGTLPGPEGSSVAFHITGRAEGERVLQLQGQSWRLIKGEYTPWIRVDFRLRQFVTARGIVRFLLNDTEPEVSLYVTPVEIDPERPALPISHPRHYSFYLSKLLGTFATLGMAEDTWALNEGAIDETAFLKQARMIQAEREAMFFGALDRLRRGVVACVFDTTDRVQHMFYRYLDNRGNTLTSSQSASVIENLYRDMDRILGRTLEYADKHTTVFVLSDHGFCSFQRGVNLNAWLHQNGYLSLKAGQNEGGEYFDGVDWSRTRAYTFGLSGIYLNLSGREEQGIVSRSDAPALKRELISKLSGLQDPDSGATAILNVHDSSDIYSGPYRDAAPDLVPGYAAGYRASWSAATGRVSTSVFETNDKAWSGDHCVDPSVVPGVLFSNRPFNASDPGIEDLAPTVLRLFGVDAPKWMEGNSLVQAA